MAGGFGLSVSTTASALPTEIWLVMCKHSDIMITDPFLHICKLK